MPVKRPSFSDRKESLQNRLTQRRDQISDRMARPRDHWQNWYERHHGHHHHWHHGHWHHGWYPGSVWEYWWNNYPVLSAFAVTTWAINRVSWAFGYNAYYNPYATAGYVDNSTVVYDYSQPIVMTPDEQTLAADPASDEPPPGVSESGLAQFDQARVEFMNGEYEAALKSTNAALKEIPNDTVIHEFRALVTFALERYNESAASLYAVLSVGPGWDWTTMSSLYPSVNVYTEQLRALENHCKQKPDDMAARFVLAYHYITAGHEDEAEQQLKLLVYKNPKDRVSADMLLQLDPDAKLPDPPKKIEPPKPTQTVSPEELLGSWQAARGVEKFDMVLEKEGVFTWTFQKGSDKPQEIRGIWSVDDEGILAMEMNDEGVMLAQIILQGNSLEFYMLGDTQGAEPLKFHKQ